MGRTAKYKTTEERVAGAKAVRQQYSQTKHGKELRAAQNRRAYIRRTQGKTRMKPTWGRIPHALKQQGTQAIPDTTHFFQSQSKNNDPPSNSDPLAIWDGYPPYAEAPSKIKQTWLDALIEQIHGRQYSTQRHIEIARMIKYQRQPEAEMLATIDADIHTCLAEWNILCASNKTFPNTSLDYKIGTVHQIWKARRVLYLLEDWKAVGQGKDSGAFEQLYHQRW